MFTSVSEVLAVSIIEVILIALMMEAARTSKIYCEFSCVIAPVFSIQSMYHSMHYQEKDHNILLS
jgi:hypothetical protein